MTRLSVPQRIWRTLAVICEILLIAAPKDLYRCLTLRRKSVVDQVIVITGGGMGIGQRMAELFAIRERAKVVILDVNEVEAKKTAKQIIDDGGRAYFFPCDITQSDVVQSCAKRIHEHPELGKVDLVVCNAGVLFMKHLLDLKESEMQASLNVNVMGCFNTIRAFLGPMMDRNEGQIVGVSSIAGFYGETYGAAYCATKFAMRGIMESLQMELLDKGLDGVKCTTVCPYFTRTPMILSKNMRPTSTWLPFMSVNRCATEIVDAILKEKMIAYMPFYIGMIVNAKVLMGKYVMIACRKYMNCRYEPVKAEETHGEGKVREDMAKSDYFRSPHWSWYLIIPPALLINFLAWLNPELLPSLLGPIGRLAYYLGTEHRWFINATNAFALVAHLAEAGYAWKFAGDRGLSSESKKKWFVQTLIIGFPSLQLLRSYRPSHRR